MSTEVRPSPPPYPREAPEKLLLSAFDQTMRKAHNYCVQISRNSSAITIPADLREASETEINAYHDNVRNHWTQFVKDSGYYHADEAYLHNTPGAKQADQILDAEVQLVINIGKANIGEGTERYNSLLRIIKMLVHSFKEICGAFYQKREVTPHTI